MKQSGNRLNFDFAVWDKAGLFLSGLCLVHCLALPALLYLAPAVAHRLLPKETLAHFMLVVFIVAVAGVAFFRGYQVHRQWMPAVLMVIGLGFIFTDQLLFSHHVLHSGIPYFSIVGSLFLLRAHYLNMQHQLKCKVSRKAKSTDQISS